MTRYFNEGTGNYKINIMKKNDNKVYNVSKGKKVYFNRKEALDIYKKEKLKDNQRTWLVKNDKNIYFKDNF